MFDGALPTFSDVRGRFGLGGWLYSSFRCCLFGVFNFGDVVLNVQGVKQERSPISENILMEF